MDKKEKKEKKEKKVKEKKEKRSYSRTTSSGSNNNNNDPSDQSSHTSGSEISARSSMSEPINKKNEKEREIEERINNLNADFQSIKSYSSDDRSLFRASGAALPDPEELKKLAKRAAHGGMESVLKEIQQMEQKLSQNSKLDTQSQKRGSQSLRPTKIPTGTVFPAPEVSRRKTIEKENIEEEQEQTTHNQRSPKRESRHLHSLHISDESNISSSTPKRTLLIELPTEKHPHRCVSTATNIQSLKDDIRKTFNLFGLNLQISYYDHTFQRYLALDNMSQLPNKDPQIKIAIEGAIQMTTEQIVTMMKNPEIGVPLSTKTWKMKNYPNCFTGKQALTWLVDQFKLTPKQGFKVCVDLMNEHYLHHISHNFPFEDKSNAYYQWQELGEQIKTTKAPIPAKITHIDQLKNVNLAEVSLLLIRNKKLVKDRKYGTLGLKKISKGFYGSEAVTFLCETYQARRNVAISLGERVMGKGFFEPVDNISLPFADTNFLYSFKSSSARPTVTSNPIDNVVLLLQRLKNDEEVAQKYDISHINDALAFLSNKSLANNNLQNQANDLLGLNKLDTRTQAIVLAHTESTERPSSTTTSSSSKKASLKRASKKSIESFSEILNSTRPPKDSTSNPTTPRGENNGQSQNNENEEITSKNDRVRERSGSFFFRRTNAFDQISDPIMKLFAQTINWEFDIFEFAHQAGGMCLPLMAYSCFEQFGLFEEFNIDQQVFKNFFTEIGDAYHRENPYHNVIHATDVLQTTFFFLKEGGLAKYLSPQAILSTLFAAAIHDVNHPGVNNAFLVNTQDDLAIFYNDSSVLENHHLAWAWRTLKKDKNNILKNLNKEQYNEIRSLIIDLVLATDFGKHFDYLGRFKNITSGVEVDFKDPSTIKIFLQTALKCADISHPAKPLKYHTQWTRRVSEEFYSQGDKEKTYGLNVSPLMDRENGNIPQSQMGFINFLVLPLYTSYGQEFPEIKKALEIVEQNLEHWKKEVEKGGEQHSSSHEKDSNPDNTSTHSSNSKNSTPEVAKRIIQRNSKDQLAESSSDSEIIVLDSSPTPILAHLDSTPSTHPNRPNTITSVFSLLRKDKQKE